MKQSGFTLLELLVGLTLMSLLTVLLATSLRSGLDVTRRVESRATDIQSMVTTHTVFRNIVETAFPSRSFDAHGASMRFGGTARALELLGPSLAGPPVGLTSQRLAILKDQMTLTDSRGGNQVITVLPSGAMFSYFGATERGQVGHWHAEWTGQRTFPSLVRLRIPGWPDAIARPRAREAIR